MSRPTKTEGFLRVNFSKESELEGVPEDTSIVMSCDGERLDGVWRYYIHSQHEDRWSVNRGNGWYSELPPLGVCFTWKIYEE